MMDRIHGVNLSGWFIPEPWVTPSLFAATGATNETELQTVMGSVAYNERIRQHYETFITEDDFRRMAAIGLNAVRLPVPWHAFGSQGESEVYISAVDYIDRTFEWARKFGMRVLLDLATVPGGQGDSNNSKSTPESVADWHSSTNGRHIALSTLHQLASLRGVHQPLHHSHQLAGVPFHGGLRRPLDTAPLPQQLHQPLGIAGSGQTVEGLLIFDQIGGQALLPLFAASFLIHTGSPFQEDFIPVYAPDEVR